MADGSKSEYEKIKGTDVIEFYSLLDFWQEKLQQQIDAYKKQAGK